MEASTRDTVSLYSLELSPNIGADHWDRQRAQRVLLTVHAHTSLEVAGKTDNVTDTIHYGHLSHDLFALEKRTFASLVHFAEEAADTASQYAPYAVHVLAEAPKLLLQAHSLSAELTRSPAHPPQLQVHINELSLHTIIGVNPPERLHRQLVITTISFLLSSPTHGYVFPHRNIVQRLSEHIEASEFRTLEAFVTSLARVACFFDGVDRVTIKAQKPSAVTFGHSSGVQVMRDRAFFLPM